MCFVSVSSLSPERRAALPSPSWSPPVPPSSSSSPPSPPPPSRLSRAPSPGAVLVFGPLLETLLSCHVVQDPESPRVLVLRERDADGDGNGGDAAAAAAAKCQRITPVVFTASELLSAKKTAHRTGARMHRRLQKPWVWEAVVLSVEALPALPATPRHCTPPPAPCVCVN
ncbi:putative calcium-binding protein CML10 [Frankliniella fusca]|uniref:Calcium-binding protein CML10 n=1 Tax=Frankliniella fusca TaxID=407009 RepID=A0AAE1LDG6_9NEOP|nr:putative calcium-binding protein CML10 [Frankliniella fusca]